MTLRSVLSRSIGPVLAAGALVAGLLAAGSPAAAGGAPGHGDRGWVGTWAASPTTVPETGVTVFQNQTLRQIVHVSTGGSAVRVRLSNEFGERPLVIGEARVARGDGEAPERIAPGGDRRLTFGGRTSVTVPPGERILSDPVALRVPALSDLAVSIYLPRRTEGTTIHASAFQQSVVAAGNVTGAAEVEASSVIEQWYFLTGVSVRGPEPGPGRAGARGSIVTLGDSITDGAITAVNADHRWPDHLARRLRAAGLGHLGVLNAGISGNRLLHDAKAPPGSEAEAFAAYFGEAGLRRFQRDVAAQPGVRYVIVLLGINDIGQPGNVAPASEEVSAAQIIDGHRRLIAAAHRRGLRIYGATLTPFEGDTLGFHSPGRERRRQAVNRWIRTSGAYDGVIDFDAAVRDPADPGRLLARFDSGDHLHPNDAGMEALAAAVPLRLFR
ncbi:SGNH/GDSL hydrolase family protein [Thermomonospora amylolytica]|uniref:SGNH/GDSL hydrolase family protein n=1 Tax=Thermomonospora amylolytica TaxID=1411117 RepID=UPI000E6B8BDD|nr:SGNH/GDSL hydrolase family protein [Thermomonospora amylolytica]